MFKCNTDAKQSPPFRRRHVFLHREPAKVTWPQYGCAHVLKCFNHDQLGEWESTINSSQEKRKQTTTEGDTETTSLMSISVTEILAHVRLVIKISSDYRGYWNSLFRIASLTKLGTSKENDHRLGPLAQMRYKSPFGIYNIQNGI